MDDFHISPFLNKLLGHTCKKDILSIAELQADDYHLDRALYLEEIHPRLQAGGGRVDKCLMRNKMSVSPTCQLKLVKRQNVISQDFIITVILKVQPFNTHL